MDVPAAREALERLLLDGPRRYTRLQVAEKVGMRLDGEVTRRPTFEVMAELEAAEDAAEAAAREARRTLHEEHKAEVKAGFDERVGKLKEKLHVS